MSTRGLFGFRQDGVDKAVYHHFDSYPEGLGAEFVKLITDTAPFLPDFFDRIIEVGSNTKPTPEQIDYCEKMDWVDLSVSNRDKTDWYCLLRGTQELLAWRRCILNFKDAEIFIENAIDFIKDSLFCEYAYIYDIDSQVLEFYKGFQTKPDPDNRYGTEPGGDENDKYRYYPCKKICEFSIYELSDVTKVVDRMYKRN